MSTGPNANIDLDVADRPKAIPVGNASSKMTGISIVIAATILVFDLSLPLGVAGGVPYVALVLMGVWFPRPQHIYLLAVLGSVLTIIGYLISPSGGTFWVVLTNRGLALFAIWVTAFLIASRKRYEDQLINARDNLESQVAERTRELIQHRDFLETMVEERTAEVSENAVQLEDALAREKEYNALQEKFVSLVSHEFRTPLSIIDGAAQRLIRRKDKLNPNEVETRANKVRSAVTRMIDMIDTTLYLSRLDAGKMDMQIMPCDIRELVSKVCMRQSEISPSHQIEVMIDDFPDEILADSRLLDQVFTNLLSNAVKYAPDNPRIEVRGWSDGENALVTVTDKGVGIPEKDLPYMFGRFFRAKTAEGIKGTGIGLNVVKEFVEMHGGSVGVDSLEGEGSTFTVRLPIGQQADEDLGAGI